MGCGASKNDVIKSASSDVPTKKESSNQSTISEASTIPAHDDMYQQNGKHTKLLPPLKPLRNPREKPPEPIAFEVPAVDGGGENGDGSLIKKHPPRRLRQLEEKSPEPVVITQEDINEKVALANQRRNQVLTQRVASARQKSARGGRARKPVTHNTEQYSMAELESEIFANNNEAGEIGMGHGHGGGFGGDF